MTTDVEQRFVRLPEVIKRTAPVQGDHPTQGAARRVSAPT